VELFLHFCPDFLNGAVMESLSGKACLLSDEHVYTLETKELGYLFNLPQLSDCDGTNKFIAVEEF
jgi:hypothetical protein